MLKLELKPKLFSEIIGIINQLVTEVNIKVNEDGLSIIALDPASAAMVIFDMPKTSFLSYEIDMPQTLAVNLDDFKQILKRFDKSESIILEKSDSMLLIRSKDGIRRKFALALINLEEEERGKPKLEFTSTIEISSELFRDAVADALIIADSCSFIADPENETFSIVASGTLNKSEISFGSDEAKLNLAADKAKYSLEYLEKFVKASKVFDRVKINFKTEHPLQLDFFSEDIDLKLSFILAPRGDME